MGSEVEREVQLTSTINPPLSPTHALDHSTSGSTREPLPLRRPSQSSGHLNSIKLSYVSSIPHVVPILQRRALSIWSPRTPRTIPGCDIFYDQRPLSRDDVACVDWYLEAAFKNSSRSSNVSRSSLGKCSRLLLQPQVNWLRCSLLGFATEQDRQRLSESLASGRWSPILKGTGKRARLRGQNRNRKEWDAIPSRYSRYGPCINRLHAFMRT